MQFDFIYKLIRKNREGKKTNKRRKNVAYEVALYTYKLGRETNWEKEKKGNGMREQVKYKDKQISMKKKKQNSKGGCRP